APTALPYGIIEYPMAMVVACLLRPYMAQDVSEGREYGLPRSPVDVGMMALDSVLVVFGMTTHSAGTVPRGERRSFAGHIRRLWPASNLLEVVLDLAVPVLFGVFAYYMVEIGDHQRQY